MKFLRQLLLVMAVTAGAAVTVATPAQAATGALLYPESNYGGQYKNFQSGSPNLGFGASSGKFRGGSWCGFQGINYTGSRYEFHDGDYTYFGAPVEDIWSVKRGSCPR